MCSISVLNWEDMDRVCDISFTFVVILCGGIPSEDTSSSSAETSVTTAPAYLVGSRLMLENPLDSIVSEMAILLYYDLCIFLVFKENDLDSKSFLLPNNEWKKRTSCARE